MDLISLSPRKQPGFTLIELMVVMAIIAILATAGIAAYTSYIKGARDSVRATTAREIITKVEAYSGMSGPPVPGQMAAFLQTEGVTVKDPLGGKPVCVDANGQARMICQFNYYQFSDGTYAISYGVENTKSLVNPHYSNLVNGGTVTDAKEIYGSFIGNNRTLTIPHAPSAAVHIEADPDIQAIPGLNVSASAISSSGGNENGATEGGGGGETCNTVVSFNEGETLNVSAYLIGACTGYNSGDPGAICDYSSPTITCFYGGTCNLTFNNSGAITGNIMASCQ